MNYGKLSYILRYIEKHYIGVNLWNSELEESLVSTLIDGLRGNSFLQYINVSGEATQIPEVAANCMADCFMARVNDKVIYLLVNDFTEYTWRNVEEFLDRNYFCRCQSIIIDLRNNSGGNIEYANRLLSNLYSEAKMYYYIDRFFEKTYVSRVPQNQYMHFDKITILINQGTMSSAELIALVLMQMENVKIIGSTSFGKAMITRNIQFNDGSKLVCPVFVFYNLTGNTCNGTGIEPCIEMSDQDIDLLLSTNLEALLHAPSSK